MYIYIWQNIYYGKAKKRLFITTKVTNNETKTKNVDFISESDKFSYFFTPRLWEKYILYFSFKPIFAVICNFSNIKINKDVLAIENVSLGSKKVAFGKYLRLWSSNAKLYKKNYNT